MPTRTYQHRTFDARPDRIDLRDRVFHPRLVSLPPRWPSREDVERHLPTYARTLVLDQGEDGACTGFGLAAMINFLQWKANGYQAHGLTPVSPRMLYHLARLYDEWPGEDYEGSSCRGAMKGWHRHGVCSEALWPYRNRRGKVAFVAPSTGWEADAASRPLGAYYRIDTRSISDMQAALYEVGALYCSANVHKGWFLKSTREPVVMPLHPRTVGGHAFALVGYTEDGFMVQNSWGPGWGYHGFAILAYEDWVQHGTDAWVAVPGAPMRTAASPLTFSTRPLQAATPATGGAGRRRIPGEGFSYQNPAVRPLDEAAAYLHTLVLGNNGQPINRLIVAENASKAGEIVCVERPRAWFDTLPADAPRKLAIYVHGGLNSETESLTRIRMMAPYFRENGIYPLFLTWKTGPLESLRGILEDSAREIFRGQTDMRDEGVADKIRQALAEARDRAIEVACENLLVKPLWSEMKQNAAAATLAGGGLHGLARHLRSLRQHVPNLEIHLAAHSAGAIVLGHLLPLLDKQLFLASLSLFAPACTVDFANRHFGAAFESGRLARASTFVDILDDERERADAVGPYGKSLLYLVSRALEARHKTPLLGMEYAWKPAPPGQWSNAPDIVAELAEWGRHAPGIGLLRLHGKRRSTVPTGTERIRLSHGSFDNDIEVVSDMLTRMRGAPLVARVQKSGLLSGLPLRGRIRDATDGGDKIGVLAVQEARQRGAEILAPAPLVHVVGPRLPQARLLPAHVVLVHQHVGALEQGDENGKQRLLALLLLLAEFDARNRRQQLQVSVGDDEPHEIRVLVRQPEEERLLVGLPFAPPFVHEDRDRQRQADDGDHVARRFQPFHCTHQTPPAKPFCRHASNTVTLTALERFMLRDPGSIGRRRRCSGSKPSRISGGRPRDSGPNSSTSFGWKATVA